MEPKKKCPRERFARGVRVIARSDGKKGKRNKREGVSLWLLRGGKGVLVSKLFTEERSALSRWEA